MVRFVPLALCALLVGSCGGDEDPAPVDASAHRAETERELTLGCADAVLGGADAAWREHSTVAGDFGLLGPGRSFENAQRREGGDLVTKTPAIVGGSEAVTLSVPGDERRSVGLYPPGRATHVDQAYTVVTFKPARATRRRGGRSVSSLTTAIPST